MMKPWRIAGLTIVADQLTKWVVRSSFTPQQSLPLLPGALHLTYVQNTGAAFSLFQGRVPVLIVISVVVAAWVAWELVRRPRHPRASRAALGLLLGGAVGNLIDRLRFGYVEDFIDLRIWPVFNVADSAITIGVACLVWKLVFPRKLWGQYT